MNKYSLILLVGVLAALAWASDEMEYRPTKLGRELVLECAGDGIVWKKKNGTVYQSVELGENVMLDGSNLKIKAVTEEDLGPYTCNLLDKVVKEYDVDVSFRLKKMPLSVSVDQGSSTQDDIKCTIVGETDVIFRWFIQPEDSEDSSARTAVCGIEGAHCQEGEAGPSSAGLLGGSSTVAPPTPLNKRAKVITVDASKDVPASSTLMIDDAQLTDRNIYICQAIARDSQNETGYSCDKVKFCEEVSTILRVKDPLAAVWPFLGIVAEVVCLCLVIFFCERRKASQEKEEELEDDGYAGNNVSANSSLRQRK